MNTKTLIGLLVVLALAGLLPGGSSRAQEPAEATDLPVAAPPSEQREPEKERRRGDLVSVFGDHIEVPAHVEQWGDIVSIGGEVTVEGELRGDVIVITGEATITGRVHGQVVGVLSNLSLIDAEIGDQLVNVAGTLRKESTYVAGQQFNMGFGEGTISLARWFGVLGAFLFWFRLLGLLIVFIALLLLAATVPDRIRRLGDETPNRIFAAFFVGLLAYLAYWILLLLLLPTVVGFFLVLVLFFVLKWLGIAGMFHWFGQRVGRSLGREMSLLGAMLIGFLPYVLIVLVPSGFGLVGLVVSSIFFLLIWIFLEIPAVGMFILTRAGGGPRHPAVSGPPAPAGPPGGGVSDGPVGSPPAAPAGAGSSYAGPPESGAAPEEPPPARPTED